jgi:HK97 gp10 family phage protein
MEVEFKGLDQVQRMLADIQKRARKGVGEQALQDGAEYLKSKVQAGVPVDDGVYRDGIEITKKGKKVIVHSGRVPHAHLVEFGRSGGSTKWVDKNGVSRTVKWGPTAPNPVVARTYEREQAKIIDVIGKSVKRELGL